MAPPLHISRRLMVSSGDHYEMALSLGATGYWPLHDSVSVGAPVAGEIDELAGASDNSYDSAEAFSDSADDYGTQYLKLCKSSVSPAGLRVGQLSGNDTIGISLGRYSANYTKCSLDFWMQAREILVGGPVSNFVATSAVTLLQVSSGVALGELTFYSSNKISCPYDQPMHVCYVQSYNGSTWDVDAFVNGTQVVNAAYATAPLGSGAGLQALHLRNIYGEPADDPWVTYQCVGLYQDVALSPTQVSKLYNAGKL